MNWIDRLKALIGGTRAHRERPIALQRVPASRLRERAPAPAAFPRFQATAGDQLHLGSSDRHADARIKLRDAFTPSQPVIDRRMFAGRTDVLTTVIRAIEDQRLHVVIYGDRGIGKTSLLHILSQVAREARYIVLYGSCGAQTDFDEMFRAIAGGIPLLFHGGFAPTDAESEQGASLADQFPDGPITPRHVSDLFAKLVGTRVIIILDEFDRTESPEFRRSVAELIKNLSDRSVRAQLVIAGVAGDLTGLVQHIPSIRRNILGLQLPRMSADEVRHLVRVGQEASGISFGPGAVETIVRVANGSPYLASLMSHHAGLSALDHDRLSVDDDDVEAAIRQSLVELHGRISAQGQLLIERASADGGAPLLGRLAGASLFSGGRFDVEQVVEMFPGQSQEQSRAAIEGQCRAAIEALVARDHLLEATDDEFGRHYRFVEESVPVYLWMRSGRDDLEAALPAAIAAAG